MIEDVTHLLDSELGTAYDQESVMFAAYDEGDIFFYDDAEPKDYERMLGVDGKARALEQVLTLPIRSATLTLRQGDASSRVTKFVEAALFNPSNNGGMSTPIDTVVAQMCGAMVNRKAYFEKVFTEKDGKVIYDKLAHRPASTCRIYRDKDTAAFKGFKQQALRLTDHSDITIPAQRAFVYIHGTHRKPLEGISDLEIAYWCYQTKQKIRFLWYSFLEGQSLPKTIVKGRDQPSADRVAKKLLALRNGGVVGVDMGQIEDISPFESSGKGGAQFMEALRWLDSEASGSVLAGFTDLGSTAAGGTGSFALSKDQTDFFLMSRQAASREMVNAMNQYLVPDLVKWNFGPNQESPELEFGPIAEDDANLAVALITSLATTSNQNTPREFLEELTERVAGFLNLNTNKVREGLERARKEAEEAAANMTPNPNAPAVAGVAGAVNTAARAVAAKVQEDAGVNTDPVSARGATIRQRE